MLVGRPWGRKMKALISLDKERIKLKTNGKKIKVPVHPSQGEPWIEPIDEEETSNNYIKYKTMNTTQNPMSMVKFT